MSKLAGEFPQPVAFGIVLAGVEDLDGHRRAAGRPPVAAPAGDRKAPHVVLQLSLPEDVVPEADVFDQFTSPIAQPGNRNRPVRADRHREHARLRLDLVPSPGRKADLRRVPEVVAVQGIVDPEPKAQPGLLPAFVDPVQVLGRLRSLDDIGIDRLVPSDPVSQLQRNRSQRHPQQRAVRFD